MNSKERMCLTMRGKLPDRVPVMCQLSLGHIYKNAGLGPGEYWYTSEGLAEGYIRMAEKYHFDGILLSRTGCNPTIKDRIREVVAQDEGHLIIWEDGARTFVPPDEYPYDLGEKPLKRDISIDQLEPSKIPVTCAEEDLPDYYFEIMDYVMERKKKELSIHGEVGTVFEQFLLQLGSFQAGLMALVDDPEKSKNIMKEMNRQVIIRALAQCRRGIDALKLSSPIAGAGFISRKMYEEFVLPFEKEVVDEVHQRYDIPCYLHTCGAIGDRLDLMLQTGIQGLECLDPPPLGTVDLAEAIEQAGDRVFIKGNLDSINEMLNHTPEEVKEIAKKRIAIGKKAKKGYILSSACSVAPKVPAENIVVLYEATEEFGIY